MQKITRHSAAATVAARWRAQYGDKPAGYRLAKGADPQEILRKLEALGAEPNPDDVDAVIGGPGWTNGDRYCNECNSSDVDVVQLGDEPDWESSTAKICGACLLKALMLIDGDSP